MSQFKPKKNKFLLMNLMNSGIIKKIFMLKPSDTLKWLHLTTYKLLSIYCADKPFNSKVNALMGSLGMILVEGYSSLDSVPYGK